MADDVVFTGNPHMWQTVGTYSSASEQWVRTTRVMQLPDDYGCVIQTETEIETQGPNREISQSLVYVRGISVFDIAQHNSPNAGQIGL